MTLRRLCVLHLVLGLAVACVCGAAACEEGADAPATSTLGTGPAYGVPPLLDEQHPGWTNPNCDGCHVLPAPGHTVKDRFVCAQCHGGNGACLPNGYNAGYNEHKPSDDCVSCHTGGKHRFTRSDVCSNCHFRDLGQRACKAYQPPTVDAGPTPPVGTPPQLSTKIEHDCFDFPAQPFGPSNGVADGEEWITKLQPGDQAVEFTLLDTAGASHTLSDLLATKPVWLQTGSYTCPVYQKAVRKALNVLVGDGDAEGAYADRIHFVHVYTVEAHPPPPDFSPYGSTLLFKFSTVPQPTTYQERLANAEVMRPVLAGAQLLLLDDLAPGARNNPVWCTYGTCPACAFLIGRDGIVHDVIERTSEDAIDLKQALDPFLAEQSGGGR
jgi:hypothetical protein